MRKYFLLFLLVFTLLFLFIPLKSAFAATLYSNDFTSQETGWQYVFGTCNTTSSGLQCSGTYYYSIPIGLYTSSLGTSLRCLTADITIPGSSGNGDLLLFSGDASNYLDASYVENIDPGGNIQLNIISNGSDTGQRHDTGYFSPQGRHNYAFCESTAGFTLYVDHVQIYNLSTSITPYQYIGVGVSTGDTLTNLVASDELLPAVNTISNATINEGDTYTASGSFADPDSTSWTGTVDYGDGSGAHAFASPNESLNQTNQTFSISHQYKDEGTYTVTVSITDNQGATSQPATATITVNNATPTIGAITVSTNPVQINNATSASASFTDAGVLDTHTASWDWGDGSTPTAGTISESNGLGTVGSDSHTYTTAGVYTITLTVTDDDGTQPSTQTFQYVSAYNPTSQGLFSAGQKYTSPAGAYAANTSLTGDVKFGLSYKYQGTMPTGVRQFTMNFNAASLTFNATTVSSLVISNGIGTLTGTGTITGSSATYNFLVTGSESAKTVRIQIKDSSGNVVYDTQPGAADTATPTTSVTGNVLAH